MSKSIEARHKSGAARIASGSADKPRRPKPLAALNLIAVTLIELSRRHESALAEHAWGRAETDRVDERLQDMTGAATAQAAARLAALQATKLAQQRLEEARVFRDRLLAALRLVLRQTGVMVEPDLLRIHARRRSTPRLLAWFARMREPVAALRKPLSQRLGADALDALDETVRALTRAVATQQAHRRELPARTGDLWRAGASLDAALTDLRLAARIAFRTEPRVLRQFRDGASRRRAAPVPASLPIASSVAIADDGAANDVTAAVKVA